MLKEKFVKVREAKFADCDMGYILQTHKCVATIAITEDEVIMSEITSFEKGGGSEMLDKVEEYARSISKIFIVSNIINPKLKRMVEKRGYVRDLVPFAPEFGIMDPVEIYKKIDTKQ